jgi:hypothetical protein
MEKSYKDHFVKISPYFIYCTFKQCPICSYPFLSFRMSSYLLIDAKLLGQSCHLKEITQVLARFVLNIRAKGM